MAAVNLSALLECTICIQSYTKQQRPMVLPCGHTFCEMCVKKIQLCPLDRKAFNTFSINYSLEQAMDPGKAISVIQQEMISKVKEESSFGPTLAALPEPPSSHIDRQAIQQVQLRQTLENRLARFKEKIMRIGKNAFENSFDSVSLLQVHNELDFLKNFPESHRNVFPDLYIHAKFLLATLYWALKFELLNSLYLFGRLAQSPLVSPEDLPFARFGGCYLALNSQLPEWRKNLEQIRHDLELVRDDQNALPLHCSMARCFLASFYLTGLGGVEQSYKQAKERFLPLLDDPFLPNELKNFSRLMIAEFYLLGLGGLGKDLLAAKRLLEEARESQLGAGILRAKICYWLGLSYKYKKQFLSSAREKIFMKEACACFGATYPTSSCDMQNFLEQRFMEKNRRNNDSFNYNSKWVPHYTIYLGLHLDPKYYQNIPGHQALISSSCVIL